MTQKEIFSEVLAHLINIAEIQTMLKRDGYVKSGDLMVNVASIPMHEFGKSNMLKISFVD